MRFNIRNPRAERWVAEQSSRLITEVLDETRQEARTLMTTGLTEGRSPRAMALDLVGRINKTTGRREGGIVGLTSDMAQWVKNAEAELRSGDPAVMRRYFDRERRDRRLDGVVRRAIRDGKPVSAEDAKKLTARYSDRLLKLRGENIARTEVLSSLHHAQDEGLRQMVDAGRVRAGQITRTWDSAEDSATRFTHRAMDNQKRGLDEPFESPNGPQLMHPGDRSLGAPASEIINCRCRVRIEIDFLAELGPGD